jgi:hypothetical protein
MVFALVACGDSAGPSPTATAPTKPSPTSVSLPTPTPSPTPMPTVAPAAFTVTSIDMAVSPQNIAGIKCGNKIKVTYTATFHVPSNSLGGTIAFLYTWNGGRASPSNSITVPAGQTTATYDFIWEGVLYTDHVLPGLGAVMTTAPNAVQSPSVKPDGLCDESA